LLDGAHFVVDSESGTDKGKEKNKEAHEAFLNQFDLIVDSIFGFSFEGVPRDPFKTIIAALARTKTPVISVDVPSGMPRFLYLVSCIL
jgi:NAD(P)H-hydrate repair Nnr-like enzyme with NAD(P)H-hydrate epimerase domain